MIEKEELPQELIHDGIRFLRTLTEVYGVEEGMQMWNKMGDVIGPNLHGQIFFAMLGGNSGRAINLTASTADRNGNAIPVIKCIRTYTGFGLKEAKDTWDECKIKVVRIECDSRLVNDFSRELRNLGCTVT